MARFDRRSLWAELSHRTVARWFLTDPHTIFGLTTNWRWTFWINVPIGIISFLIIALHAADPPRSQSPRSIISGRFLGHIISSLILAVDNTDKIFASLIEGGVSNATIKAALHGIALLCAGLFLVWAEACCRTNHPTELFRNRTFSTLMAVGLLFGAAFLGAILYPDTV